MCYYVCRRSALREISPRGRRSWTEVGDDERGRHFDLTVMRPSSRPGVQFAPQTTCHPSSRPTSAWRPTLPPPAHGRTRYDEDEDGRRALLDGLIGLKPLLHGTTVCTTGSSNGKTFVYATQPAIRPAVQPVGRVCTRYNRLYDRDYVVYALLEVSRPTRPQTSVVWLFPAAICCPLVTTV